MQIRIRIRIHIVILVRHALAEVCIVPVLLVIITIDSRAAVVCIGCGAASDVAAVLAEVWIGHTPIHTLPSLARPMLSLISGTFGL